MKRQAADQAATARAFNGPLLLGRGRSGRRRVGCLDVVPAQRALVMQDSVCVAALCLSPLATGLDEQGPIWFALREALRVLGRLAVDLAHGGTEAELHELVLDAGLVHQGLAVDRVGAEPVSYTHLRAHETRHDLVCR